MPFNLSAVTQRFSLSQSFTILRTTGSFAAGGWQADAPTEIPAVGVIVPADAKALAQVPEADRVTGSLQIICEQKLHTTSERSSTISDKVRWHGDIYRVTSLLPWNDFGFYSAILVRVTGS
jgi:hypothetical protein